MKILKKTNKAIQDDFKELAQGNDEWEMLGVEKIAKYNLVLVK